MQNPRNLRVYGQALELAATLYRLTSEFPGSERYGLIAQMRRAAVSVGSNIAEGCGRQGNRALMAALHHSLGSLDELEFQAELARKLSFCTDEAHDTAIQQLVLLRRAVVTLISALRRRPNLPGD